jgi:beta-mannanase
LGLYLPDDFPTSARRARQYEALLEKRIAILSFYTAWGPDFSGPDLAGIRQVMESGFIPMITWEPWCYRDPKDAGRPEDQPDFSLSVILDGRYDDYIRRWAADLRNLPDDLFFRPMHEMNGNWYPWCGTVNGNGPEEYIKTWHYIRAIFREERNDRLIWVWSPYAHSVPEEGRNEMIHYFPGSPEVDWVGLDGYNWGNSHSWSRWQCFEDIFRKGYKRLAEMAPDRPFMIAETGCAEEGGDKGKWIEDSLGALPSQFPRIEALIWFNINKECDWRIDSSPESTESFIRTWGLGLRTILTD